MLDLNSDLGEGVGSVEVADDDALLSIVSSANIACGFHGGDASIMRRTCERAVSGGVRIGAHISYPDLEGFGRRPMDLPPAQVGDQTLYQIGALDAAARVAGDRIRYVKPHGALYHSASSDPELADAIVAAMRAFDPHLALLGPHRSELERAATRHEIAFFAEGFVDRAYTESGDLVPRSEPGAVLGQRAALAQALSLATSGTAAVAGTGDRVTVPARSLCVHGDSPDAVAMARAVRAALVEQGIEIRPFT
ncbi:LamB/YcsF family protein [Rhodococcus sp. D2-41]|uniref:LamB/YcsF family protein n=1 Tax=Speluncibacter jeojiensis TaxID=2710754 RepID=A0A9X4M7P0_9ACTN|nr:5-oxoprolinase subunit PxpA [Rhodococcus sp. D2-41]MDG3010283.1 LamB/YcsF family protein [Rhodococcus sp. D2-41]MDG3015796.1 LamB/YcsF family protein [Corynebacteriales bacterium D3-21]